MQLGIFLNDIGNNQLAIDTIASVNSILNRGLEITPTLFFKQNRPLIIKPKTTCVYFDKMYTYDGHVITTSLDTTAIALQCRRLKSINFVVTELEWTFGVGNYFANRSIYCNPNINLFTTSTLYRDAIDNYCNVTPTVINGLNINEIINIIRSRNSENV